ncbi:MAG: CbtA family protein [Burkholderiales bacterium]
MPLGPQRSFRHIVLSAVISGWITGMLITLVQQFTTGPLIAQAEIYEQRGEKPAEKNTVAEVAAGAPHDQDAELWKPKNSFERTFYTGVTTVLVAIGYALLLGACLSQMRTASWRTGLALGVAGFLVFQLAPALGLPPEPPGAPYADLVARQLWWVGTAIATASALGAWFYTRSNSKAIWIPVGIVLILLPHVIGVPQALERQVSIVPHELSQRFALAALITTAAFWLALGSIQGYVFGRLCQRGARG